MPALNTDEFMEGKTVEYVKLANGVEIPKIGYGVFQISKDDAPRCVREAIETGYRHIDTAQSYFNEAEVGQGIKDSGIDRKDLFLTTKIWISNYGYENTLRSVDVSLKKLGTDYLDLVLLHQPFSDTYGAWRALEKLYKDGVIRAIGVSNFYPDRLADMVAFNEIAPMVDQVETNPLNQQIEARKNMVKRGVAQEAWAPFGEGHAEHVLQSHPGQDWRGTWQVRRAGDPALAHSARHRRSAQVHAQGAHGRKPEHLRFPALRQRDDNHRGP